MNQSATSTNRVALHGYDDVAAERRPDDLAHFWLTAFKCMKSQSSEEAVGLK